MYIFERLSYNGRIVCAVDCSRKLRENEVLDAATSVTSLSPTDLQIDSVEILNFDETFDGNKRLPALKSIAFRATSLTNASATVSLEINVVGSLSTDQTYEGQILIRQYAT